jgi:hypothetical protein
MKVQQFKDEVLVNTFNSITHASKMTNIKRDIILKCCKGKQKTTNGYVFKYL